MDDELILDKDEDDEVLVRLDVVDDVFLSDDDDDADADDDRFTGINESTLSSLLAPFFDFGLRFGGALFGFSGASKWGGITTSSYVLTW